MTIEKEKKRFFALLFLFLGIIFFYNLSRPAWIEPDAIGFYNRTCEAGTDFSTPIVSRTVFEKLPCNETIWKIFQSILTFAAFSAIYFSLTKILQKDYRATFMVGLSYFFVLFLLALEDDQLFFPILIVTSVWLLKNPTWKKRILYGILAVVTTFFVWEGAYVIMGLLLLSSIYPWLSLLVPISGFLTNKIHLKYEGNISELQTGLGFFTNNIILWVLAFGDRGKLFENKTVLGALVGLLVLTFFVPKFGVFIIIPLLFLIEPVMGEKKMYRFLAYGGLFAMAIISVGLLIDSEPTSDYWRVVDKAIVLQEQGETVYNEWWVGRWVRYKGGFPTLEGSDIGPQVLPFDTHFYWLGKQTHPDTCETIDSAGILFLQECKPRV